MALGFETDRLKTGTPARVDSRTVDFAHLEAQPGDADVRWFSFDSSVRAYLSHAIAPLPAPRAPCSLPAVSPARSYASGQVKALGPR